MLVYKELLKLAYYIPRTGEKPPALLLVGKPGVGKSHLLCNYRATNCMYMSDVTAAGIETVLNKFDKDPEFSFVVIPDLINVLSRGGKNKRFISFLNVALEEGVKAVLRKDIEWKTKNGGAHVGVISATTTAEFQANKWLLQGTGFLSRSFIVDFDPDTTEAAMQIARGHKDPGLELQIPKELHFNVPITEPAAEALNMLGHRWAKDEDEKPLRRVYLLRRFARAKALVEHVENGRELKLQREDVEHVWGILSAVRFNLAGKRGYTTDHQQGVRKVTANYSKWGSKANRKNAG
jgi:hypothetical protein